ncbi:MAG: hypothetical protein IJN31_06620, partial [Peptococcaceae bacterium]|nr:hypothetical protein [Peptococcaceae bacterium]
MNFIGNKRIIEYNNTIAIQYFVKGVFCLERIDKIIASQGKYSRSDVKSLISKRRVTVDGVVVKSSGEKADAE